MWLLVLQRLRGRGSLQAAVLELLRGLPATFWPRPCKRLRQWREHGQAPSSHTGAYNQARQALPLSIVEQSCDRIFQQLVTRMDQTGSEQAPRAFLLDGSSMRLPHNPELCELYPPGSNQYGEGHWPVLRVLVAHDLHTGLAMRPQWGPMYGLQAVSEQELLERAIHRLPSGSRVVGDANFGVFSVAYTAVQRGHPVVLRLTADRARRLAGGDLPDGIDRAVVWQPSANDRRSHPDLPANACLSGRLIVRRVQPGNGAAPFLLALFTTLPLTPKKLLGIYGQRWAIETDLRTLKSELCLDELTCTTPDMVAKEIDMGIAAYNLVRAMMGLASQQSGLPPRGYSFSKVRSVVQTFAPALADAPSQTAAKRIFDLMMQCVQQAKLPRRKRKRPSYPRAVWKRRDAFPKRKK
jgi:putative transposase